MVKAALGMWPELVDYLFDAAALQRLQELTSIDVTRIVTSIDELSEQERAELEVLIAGWGMDNIDAAQLSQLPKLRAVVHTAGGVRFLPADAAERGVLMSANRAVNGIPVAEWTVSMIVLAAKGAFWASRRYCQEQHFEGSQIMMSKAGLYAQRVGIISASNIGKAVMEMLKHYDVEVLLYDPFATPEQAAELGAELVEDLTELARRSDILSIHAPVTEQTKRMVSRDVLAALRDGATIINTSRGIVVDQDALVDELEAGRLFAIIDVTEPEVLPKDHPLYTLPNVFLTPHLAGSVGTEIRRLGATAIQELERFVSGEQFQRLTSP